MRSFHPMSSSTVIERKCPGLTCRDDEEVINVSRARLIRPRVARVVVVGIVKIRGLPGHAALSRLKEAVDGDGGLPS